MEQLSLFDFGLTLDEAPKKKRPSPKKASRPKNVAYTVIKAVKESVTDYLAKGERILTLAKEEFERKFNFKYDFSDFEKKVYTLKYDKSDSCTGLDVYKPLAREFRKLLKSIEVLDESDEAYKTLMGLFKGTYNVTMTESPVSAVSLGGFKSARVEVELRDGTCVCHGLLDSAHSKSRRNAYYTSHLVEYYREGCTDLAYFFAHLFILTTVSKELVRARDEDTFFYEKNQDLLEGNLKAKYPYYFMRKPYFREGILTEEQQETMKRILGKDDIPTHSKYGYTPEEDEWGIARSMYEILTKSLEPFNILHSETEDVIDLQSNLQNHRDNKYILPNSGPKVWFYYDLFLDIAEEKGAYIREAEYIKESGHVARAFETKKNIPERTIKAMQESEFNNYFSYVEFDEDVDLEKVAEIAKEFIAVKEEYVSGLDIKDNQIRFRKLGKHKALGLYYPILKCLCVDINAPSSLIHEFGHLIDHKLDDLSSKFDFYEIRRKYEACVDAAMGDDKRWNGHTKYNREYYLRPTEIFARSFEIYMSKVKGVNNSILETPEGYERFCYPSDNAEYMELVEKYFDKVLATVNAKAVDKTAEVA